MAEPANHGSGTAARRKSWAVAMGGAYVMALGWDIASTPISDLEDCGRLRRFMESTNFHDMAPHDELSRGVTAFVLADPGERYVAYASTAGDMGIAAMTAGTYRLRWFDAADASEIAESAVAVSGGDQVFARPSGLGDEVALYAVRE